MNFFFISTLRGNQKFKYISLYSTLHCLKFKDQIRKKLIGGNSSLGLQTQGITIQIYDTIRIIYI